MHFTFNWQLAADNSTRSGVPGPVFIVPLFAMFRVLAIPAVSTSWNPLQAGTEAAFSIPAVDR
jgi:hypothetical protein